MAVGATWPWKRMMMLRSALLAVSVACIPACASSERKIDMGSASPIVAQWTEAYNRHDVEKLMECYGDDMTNTQIPWGRTVTGRDAMRAVYAKTFSAFPDIAIRTVDVICAGDMVVLRWEFGGTMMGEFAGAKPTNRRFLMEGCEVFRISGGRIREQYGYWDKETMFTQLEISKGKP